MSFQTFMQFDSISKKMRDYFSPLKKFELKKLKAANIRFISLIGDNDLYKYETKFRIFFILLTKKKFSIPHKK